jgi:uncharacterized protein YndB with AHSA1/START domain
MENDQLYTVVDGHSTMTVFEIYIKTTPERLWEAITDEEMRKKYSFGVETSSDRHPRPVAQGRQQRTLRRLADDSLRPEDAAGDGRVA